MNDSSGPTCIGIIMDGNRRWAREHNLPSIEGHTEGYKKLQEVVRWVRLAGIPQMVVYGFSTENWLRSEEEVTFLLKTFRSILENEREKMVQNKVRVQFIGDRNRFGDNMQKMMEEMETETAKEYDISLHILMSYGGRAEIVAATNALLAEGQKEVSEDTFAKKLWSYPTPDPDLIIRTGGEKRLSNFLTWQSVYSELFFVDSYWPAFTKEEFDAILAEFAVRERRHGK